MQLYICVKHVPDSAANITIVEKNRIDENLTFLLNPYDEHAVTEAVRIKDNLPGSEIIAVCLGKDDAEKTLRSALAMGADRGLLIASDKNHDSIETAQALKAAIEQDGNPGLIFTGKESIDAEGMQTMFRIGALFDFPVATNVVRLDIESGRAVVDSALSGGTANTYELSFPCVIGAGRGLNTPRYPTFPDVVKSKKKPVKKIAFPDLKIEPSTAGMNIVELEPLLQSRDPKEITGDAGEIAETIMRILKDEAKVI
ncbi:electron transfer flavoprotein subunit beta/FixA family protein [Desulfobacula sp.]|uniref:electron transfer flavoprotein subunit beta/FixA family protein n=1 Tax=Desulfobacula sp. TaxID=2593537 RepID=UPI0025C48670|nr:electron transfer flavoprotein subunit beta/FixA family protein [Desulfobacula sp.]MBC2706057.1 electron transfer flavoprotein subunit beta/FixA family protein [Desulfobacula sp.]